MKRKCIPQYGWLLFSLAVFFIFVVLWLSWPFVMHLFASVVERVLNSLGDDWERCVKTGTGMANLYSVFSALLTVFTVGTGFLTYISVHISNRRQQASDRILHFRNMQVREISNLFNMINEYDRAVVALDYNGNRSYKVIGDLYDRYREPELKILTSRLNGDEKRVQLDDLDAKFYKEAEAANLLESASIVFRILNWMYAYESYLKESYADDEILAEDISKFRERLIGLVSRYMTNQTKFVYGKYRHLRYHLGRREWPHALSMGYRGSEYADRLFAYERTLNLLTTCDAEAKREFRNMLDKRYAEEGIDERLKYYPAALD